MSLGCDGGGKALVSAITWHVLRLEKRAVWLVSLLLLKLTVRDVQDGHVHGMACQITGVPMPYWV